MKRLVIVLLSLSILLTGCSKQALAGYIDALKETGNIESGRQKLEASVDIDFNTDNMTADEKSAVRYFEHMDFTNDLIYDETGNISKAIAKSYGNIGGMGIDTTVYVNDDQVYIYIPMLGGYYNLNTTETKKPLDASLKIGEAFKPVIDKFIGLLNKEDIIKGKKTYITTEDGQIKTTIYTVNINEVQLKEVLDEFIKQIENQDIPFEEFLPKGVDIGDFDLKAELEKWLNSFTLTSFSSTAYVDFDGRLVKQSFDIELGINNSEDTNGPSHIKASALVTYSGLGEKQELKFPEVTEFKTFEEGFGSLWNY